MNTISTDYLNTTLKSNRKRSLIFFSYLLPFFHKGLKKEHDENDMYQISNANLSSRLGDKLQKTWQDQLKKKKNPSLLWTMGIVFKWEIIKFGIVNATLESVR